MLIICVLAVIMLWLVWPGIQSLSQIVAKAARERRQEIDGFEQEVERLDRIRNPAKYLGK